MTIPLTLSRKQRSSTLPQLPERRDARRPLIRTTRTHQEHSTRQLAALPTIPRMRLHVRRRLLVADLQPCAPAQINKRLWPFLKPPAHPKIRLLGCNFEQVFSSLPQAKTREPIDLATDAPNPMTFEPTTKWVHKNHHQRPNGTTELRMTRKACLLKATRSETRARTAALSTRLFILSNPVWVFCGTVVGVVKGRRSRDRSVLP